MMPPEGYRLLKDGEKIEEDDLGWGLLESGDYGWGLLTKIKGQVYCEGWAFHPPFVIRKLREN